MVSWRDTILKNFEPKISRLTLVADPDGLLTEEGMLSAIQNRGFALIPFDDSIAFRYAYESEYRSRWDKGEKPDLVVVLRSANQELAGLPFDLQKAGRPLTFALHRTFPKLNYPVIAALDREYLDSIDEAYRQYDGEQLTERETKDFVLVHCFSIVPKLLKKPIDLLKVLLSLHSRQVRLPGSLVEYLLESLTKAPGLQNWPLVEILPSREAFLRFLQEEWVLYLGSLNGKTQESRVPFSHEDVRAYVDTLFLDGLLSPVELDDVSNLPPWARTGVAFDPQAEAMGRYLGLSEKFESEIPADAASHREWQQAAQRWAELVVLRWELDEALDVVARAEWGALQDKVESAFGHWMHKRYSSLHNLPYHKQPVMLHHVPRFMASEKSRQKAQRTALLVLDGLAYDQWLLLRKSLEGGDNGWRFKESPVFAWVPTLTSVSRQSIFAGEPPLYFPDSLGTTAKEKSHWLRFWEDHGVQRARVDLVTSLDGPTDPRLETVLGNTALSVLGIVWNKVDDIMHGMEMQTAGMHSHVRLWASQGHLHQLLLRLHGEGFLVYLTADHGNVTATGVGNPREGVLAETKGQRVRVYDRPEFLEEVAAKFPEAVRWPNYGLPPDRHVLLAGNLRAFTAEGGAIVSHGGIALEEVIVPFVAITRVGA